MSKLVRTGKLRWQVLGAALVTVLIVALGAWLLSPNPAGVSTDTWVNNTGVLGDLDGDGVVSKAERTRLDQAQVSASVAQSLSGHREAHMVMLTPSGEDWWRLISGLAPDLTPGKPPLDADWYALTQGVADSREVYQVLHVPASNPQAASTWVESLAAQESLGAGFVAVRGSVVSFASIDVHQAGITELVPTEVVEAVATSVGYWWQDFSAWIIDHAAESASPKAYRSMWRSLGFPPQGGVWEATSSAPGAVWTGRLPEFNIEKLSVKAALNTVVASEKVCLLEDIDCVPDAGLSLAAPLMFLADNELAVGDAQWKPKALANEDFVLAVGLSPQWQEAINGTPRKRNTTLRQLGMWYTADGLLHVHPQLGEPVS